MDEPESRVRAVRRLALMTITGLCLAGCGASAGRGAGPVSVVRTADFGARALGPVRVVHASAREPLARLVPGAPARSTFVNGIAVNPAKAQVYGGDRLWLDRHAPPVRVPAVVGAFPEPFHFGSGGKRFPVRIECASVGDAACHTTEDRLVAAGVGTAAVAGVGGTSGKEVLRVLVGPWRIVGGDPALEQLGRGPTLSGVFVRPAPSGTAIAVLNAAGRTVRTLGPGDGLVAATRIGDQQPTWAVTGVDEAGALAAARALSAGALHDRFAAAVVAGRGVVSVP
jgi:hypothetical protein